jgi:hypothetical protein
LQETTREPLRTRIAKIANNGKNFLITAPNYFSVYNIGVLSWQASKNKPNHSNNHQIIDKKGQKKGQAKKTRIEETPRRCFQAPSSKNTKGFSE